MFPPSRTLGHVCVSFEIYRDVSHTLISLRDIHGMLGSLHPSPIKVSFHTCVYVWERKGKRERILEGAWIYCFVPSRPTSLSLFVDKWFDAIALSYHVLFMWQKTSTFGIRQETFNRVRNRHWRFNRSLKPDNLREEDAKDSWCGLYCLGRFRALICKFVGRRRISSQ